MATKPRSTILPPPPLNPTQSLIEQTLHLTPLTALGSTIFTNTRPLWHPPGARGVYGGAVIAQSLAAAQRTVPLGLWVHSMHCYFVLAGDAGVPIVYYVEDLRGDTPGGKPRSFATREVKAKQRGKIIFVTLISFQRGVRTGRSSSPSSSDSNDEDHKNIATHEQSIPEGIPDPLLCESELDKLARLEAGLSQLKSTIAKKKETDPSDPSIEDDEIAYEEGKMMVSRLEKRVRQDPFEWRKVSGSLREHNPTTPIPQRKIRQWVRARDIIGSDSSATETTYSQLAALAYFSDSWFIGTVTRVNPQAANRNLGMMVSLDHTIYFHLGEDTKVDGGEWLLVEMESPWAGEERGLVVERVWRKSDGKLVASCFQEGLVRLRDGRVGDQDGERGSKL